MIVTLLGRSNVGKSSLFNALASSQVAIPNFMKSLVSEQPGTTRNAKYGQVYIKGRRITLVDTGGIESIFSQSTGGNNAHKIYHSSHILDNAVKTAENSDMVLFVVDGQEGITPLDIKIASKLRQLSGGVSGNLRLKLIVNKLDREGSDEYYEALSKCLSDCYSLGLGEPIFVSTHSRDGAQKIRNIISKTLNVSCSESIRRLEQLALTESLPKLDGEPQEKDQDDSGQDPDEIEIDKSIRLCSSVKSAFLPNDRWIRHLTNICDSVPFATETDGKYVVPSALSPGEMLAKMYIPRESTISKGFENGVNNTTEDLGKQGIDEATRNAKNQKDPKVIRPLRVTLLGTVGNCQKKLIGYLSGKANNPEVDVDIEDTLSPNWHQYYGEWKRLEAGETLSQPVEIFLAAALNLGGSLGKVSSIQTLNLIRRADIVIMCIGETDQRNPWKVALTKKEASWMTRVLRLHKPVVVVTPVSQSPNRKMVFDSTHKSLEVESIPIHPFRMTKQEIENVTHEEAPPEYHNRLIKKIQKDVLSLIDRGEKRIETSSLNKWLRSFLEKWPPPWHDGSKVNVKFAAQCSCSPPTFVIWSNVCGVFPQHYMRQIKRAMSEEFGFHGVPLKFILRTTAQPKSTSRRDNLSWKRKLHNI
ncbi:ribosome biogenesis related GTPase, putative [Babesia ovis]|uniref:Ribosome biogenesis related GTPase, putative n=1 Tax=Babesia ovis TaxID=5869 RepID=A0A9W5WUJ6_BABOV|nr:ribosome biogenesis related GTPase, putative [Babesia ovis]